ncbi:HU family DNA-binding protein [Mesonia ostreae]|uniref:DNA-binding protein n=1 Tax=Mesonia ostreae TaxID=861110 RepID=A0ABU2KM14_9FLAO|nr:HU family DNA-binding protein [Mesonia ostreae]MDT0295760.1 DNA-binding protein [Mesonia ostreae]
MIKVKTIARKNPQDLQAPEQFYLHAVKDGVVDFERLAYLISNQSTVREADCLAVLNALQHNMMDELAQGRVVQLGSLGNFQVGIRCEGSSLPEEVNASKVRSAHINYRPGKRLRKALLGLEYKLISG